MIIEGRDRPVIDWETIDPLILEHNIQKLFDSIIDKTISGKLKWERKSEEGEIYYKTTIEKTQYYTPIRYSNLFVKPEVNTFIIEDAKNNYFMTLPSEGSSGPIQQEIFDRLYNAIREIEDKLNHDKFTESIDEIIDGMEKNLL